MIAEYRQKISTLVDSLQAANYRERGAAQEKREIYEKIHTLVSLIAVEAEWEELETDSEKSKWIAHRADPKAREFLSEKFIDAANYHLNYEQRRKDRRELIKLRQLSICADIEIESLKKTIAELSPEITVEAVIGKPHLRSVLG